MSILNPNTQEAEASGSEFKESLVYRETLSLKKL